MECFYYIKKMLPASGIELALSFAPVSALLNGGGVPVICSAPVSECWPELDVKSQAVLHRAMVRRRCRLLRSPQLRRGGPRRRTGGGALSSGERPSQRRWGSGNLLCSCERMLAGAGREIEGCPPSSNGSSEVQTLRSPQLRRGGPRRRTGVGALSSGEYPSHRRWGSGNLLCSCERMLAGAGREIAGCPPSSDGSSEVQTLRSPQLRRGKPHRGWTRSKYPALHEPSAAKQKPPLARA